jgi:hypothetical protein
VVGVYSAVALAGPRNYLVRKQEEKGKNRNSPDAAVPGRLYMSEPFAASAVLPISSLGLYLLVPGPVSAVLMLADDNDC